MWQFRVMAFGLCNAPATFERMVERVLVDFPRSRCVVYLDDLLMHAGDFAGVLANLQEVLAAVHRAGLRLNPAKCSQLTREILFLGPCGISSHTCMASASWSAPTTRPSHGSSVLIP